MKKSIFLISILIILTCLFSSCIPDSNSIYWDPWVDTEGYVTRRKTGRTDNSSFVSFEEGTPPEGSYIAVRYEHAYDRRPYCSFDVYKRETDIDKDIVEEFVKQDDKSDDFIISKTPYDKIQGFVFYCDDNTVYIINDLYQYGYRETTENKADTHFKIRVSGIRTLDLYMKHVKSNLPY